MVDGRGVGRVEKGMLMNGRLWRDLSVAGLGGLLLLAGAPLCGRSAPANSEPSARVVAFYYPWYGNPGTDGRYANWNHPVAVRNEPPRPFPGGDDIGANFYPARGCYSVNDSEVLRQHMQELCRAGVGVLCASWWGRDTFTDRALPGLFRAAEEAGLLINFHLEPFPGRNAQTTREAITYLTETYGASPALHRLKDRGNRPVFFVYDSYLTPAAEWSEVLGADGARTIRGTDVDAVVIGLWVKEREEAFMLEGGFDGFYTYFATDGFTYGSTIRHWPRLAEWARTNGKLFVPCVAPGYIDTRIRPWNGGNTRGREQGAYYDRMWSAALGVAPELVAVTSFNEWHEGTQIEPAIPKQVGSYTYEDYGSRPPEYYLDRTAHWVRRFEGESPAGDGAALAPAVPPADPTLRLWVEADWQRQLEQQGRAAHERATIRDLVARTERLEAHLRGLQDGPALESWSAAWSALVRGVDDWEARPASQREALYEALRWAARDLMLRHPSLQNRPVAFMKRRRFICQMLHEYLGYYYDYGDLAGGGVFVLEAPGRSSTVRDLVGARLGEGNFTTLAMDYEARRLYFAFAPRAPAKPDFYTTDRRCFHLFVMDTDGSNLCQLTFGPDDDFDPCPLPDGAVAFMSTRRGGFGRCHNPWEPLPTYTLHRLEADGSVRTLSWHETNEWHPWVLNDGRLVYTRWDYVDRSAANFHGLWVCNPDGSDPTSLFGNYTMRINACYQPRSIPGSDRLVFVAGAHHADVGGSLVLVDPHRASPGPGDGEDSLADVEVLTPEVCFPEAPGWPSTYYHSPWPLSEQCYLVAYSSEPLPGMGPGEKRDTPTGLYYFDRFGNLELLYRDPAMACMYPVPLAARPKPPVVPSQLDPALGDEGEFLLSDVRRSLFPLPPGRPVTQLRVFQVLPKTGSHVANQPRLGYANAESARMFLGTVPVEADGSAYFRAPARKPLYFQAVDGEGRAIQSMRSITYLQPGERVGCVGCHEPRGDAPPNALTLAARRPPSRLQPGPDGSMPLSFARLVQPVLDGHCVSCHNGSPGAGRSALDFRDGGGGEFSGAYENLKPFVRWYEWGGASISQIATRPGECGADASPLMRILQDADHADLKMPEPDLRRLLLWMDANVPFYGTYEQEARLAQRRGEAVPPPLLQ